MREVIAGRHVYVFGTGGDPTREELERRRARALRAAEWSVDRGPFWGRVMVFPRVVADTDVRPSDLEGGNLVLFGTKETNGVIARLRDRLPLHLDSASQDDYGLVYVYPVDERYVLVSSGLPWWEAGAGAASPFTSAIVAFLLAGWGDYLLFEGSTDNVVAEGRFDNDWRLSAAAAAAMRATGAVTVTSGAGARSHAPARPARVDGASAIRASTIAVRVDEP